MVTQYCGEAHEQRMTQTVGLHRERKPMHTSISRKHHHCHSVSLHRRFSGWLVPLVALTAFVLMPQALANAAACHVYGVTLQGIASTGDGTMTAGAQQFTVAEYAVWRDAGVTSHPVEFWLTPLEALNASAQVGKIELMTNSYFARNAGIASARFDLASVAISNVIQFQIDSGMSFQMPQPNIFLAPGMGSLQGGLGGLGFLSGAGGQLGQIINGATILSVSYFVPYGGGGYFYSPDGSWLTIAGELGLAGMSLDNAGFQGQYQAQFSGSYLGSLECP